MATATDDPQENELRNRQRRPSAGERTASDPLNAVPSTATHVPESLSSPEHVSAKQAKTYGRTPDGTGK